MTFFQTHIFDDKSKYRLSGPNTVPKKINWWFAPIFVAFWLALYLGVVLNLSISLPTPLKIEDEANAPDRFIAERAQAMLLGLVNLGPRVVGSEANEIGAVNYLMSEIEKIENQTSDFFEIETDIQVASGSYNHWNIVNMYQGIQNVVVKLSAKGSTSETYLLINSHFDSVPGSPGGGDDGSMVAVMMEILRVIAKSNGPLEHPIVFLFNGAEENPLQGSHAFITQHKWAKNCKALINLDSAGNGGKEILFQSGPKHPWLMRYYRQNVVHPFASTMGEEIFKANLIPSDTDFRNFRDFGGVPGLDFAYTYNGYVYHTKYDRYNIVPMGSLQNTGDNILAVAKAIANAPELDNISEHEDGHVIFYDFLGWFIIFYTQTVSTIINTAVCLIAISAIGISLFFMGTRSEIDSREIIKRFGITFGLHILSLILGSGLSLLIAVLMDAVNRSMTWFSSTWLLFGLYCCPMIFGMGILPAIYSQYMKRDGLSLGFRIQMFMHAHCLLLVVLTIGLTCAGIRSAFMLMLAVFFDVFALVFNLVTRWHMKEYLFAVAIIVCQILPFIYFTNIFYTFVYSLVPMTGRNGTSINPDLLIAALTILMTLLFAGFLIPLFLLFRKTRTLISLFLIFTIICMIIALTPVGFPYQPQTAAQRFNLIHAKRVLYNADDTIRTSDSGIYLSPQDRRTSTVDDIVPGITKGEKISSFCGTEMFCGVPSFNHRWYKAIDQSYWIKLSEPSFPSIPKLELLSREIKNETEARFEFKLTGTDHMTIYIGTKNGAKIKNWTFDNTIREKFEQPYFIYFSYGKDSSPLEFFIEIETEEANFYNSTLEIGIGAHWIHQNITFTKDFQQFLDSFPTWTYVSTWIASYESWIY